MFAQNYLIEFTRQQQMLVVFLNSLVFSVHNPHTVVLGCKEMNSRTHD